MKKELHKADGVQTSSKRGGHLVGQGLKVAPLEVGAALLVVEMGVVAVLVLERDELDVDGAAAVGAAEVNMGRLVSG